MSAALGLILLSAWIEAAGLGLLALLFAGRLPGRAWPERLGLGYIMGLGAVCWLSFLWMFAGWRFSWAGVAALTLPLIAGGAWRTHRATKTTHHQSNSSYHSELAQSSRFSRLAWFALAVVCGTALVFQTFYLMRLPLFGWDPLELWGYKTQVLLHRGALWTVEDTNAAVTNTPRTYPHFLPIAQFMHARAAGAPLIESGAWKIFFGLLQAAFTAFFYGMARRRLGPLAAMAFTALAATMPHFVNLEDGGPVSGYADVMLAVYYFLAVGAMWRWIEERDVRWLVLAAMAAGLCYFTKREGVLAAALSGAAALLLSGGWSWRDAARRKILPALGFAAIMGAVILPVWAYARAVEVNPDLVGAMLRSLTWEYFVERIDRLWFALGETGQYLFLNPHTWALAWWGVAGLALARPRAALRPGAAFLLAAAVAPIVNFCIVGVVTTFPIEGLMKITFPRIVQITIGPVFFYLAVMLAPWLVPSAPGASEAQD